MVTYRRHFNDDMDRVIAILDHANTLSGVASLVRDLRLSAIAMAVGAMDAYFCDAYADCLTAVLQTYVRGDWRGILPDVYSKVRLPGGIILSVKQTKRPLWRIRMAAEGIMEKDNMLDVSRFAPSLNGILDPSDKLWHSIMPDIVHKTSPDFTGIHKNVIKPSANQIDESTGTMKKKLSQIIQLRHDWIHNCGRPKEAIESYYNTDGKVRRPIEWIRTLVCTVDDHLQNKRLC